MHDRNSHSSHIVAISRSLISIVAVICIFQLISLGLVIDRSVHNYRDANQFAALDNINRALFVATDQVARERNLSLLLLAGQQAISQRQQAQLIRVRQQADQRFALALDQMAQQPEIQSMLVTTLRERLAHYQQLRREIDQRLIRAQPFTDETLGYELSLASAELITKTNLVVHVTLYKQKK